MRKFSEFCAVSLLVLLAFASFAQAEYWFQSGARAGGDSDHNNGASLQIQTIAPQNISSGSMAFWVGETLSNGAFLQVGYSISNESGVLATNCTAGSCTSNESIKAGDAEWFYEYFKTGDNETFNGETGPDGSAGANGTFHTYSFRSKGNMWYFLVDNKTMGSANLGASDSGFYTPLAMSEVANTSTNSQHMKQVLFSNLSAYKYGILLPVSSAYGTIAYGEGSKTDLRNKYGVSEIDSRVNYFAAGSGLNTSTNNTKLWSLGYRLTINSQYGNISSRNVYSGYSVQTLYAPQVINITPRERAVFAGWTGSGLGFYTGPNNKVQLLMTYNITETADWQLQYLVNVSSPYGYASGSGWYNQSSPVRYNISETSVISNSSNRLQFAGWSTGAGGQGGSTPVTGPLNIVALWRYRLTFQPVDAYGKAVNVSYLIINNRQYNSTPLLYTGRPSRLEGIGYKGVSFPLDINVTQDSAPSQTVQLPLYNVSIRAAGLLGVLPANATATITYKNGTTSTAYTGAGGTLNIPDVPYGYANITLNYLGYEQHFVMQNGGQRVAYFVSVADIIIFVIILAIGVYMLDKRIKEKKAGAKQNGKV